MDFESLASRCSGIHSSKSDNEINSSISFVASAAPAFPSGRRGRRFKSDRGTRGNRRRGRAANICDRSGRSSVDERFAGWKASPSRWKDAGETEWWRHGQCGQVARKDAAGRSPVHPFAPTRPLANGCPPSPTVGTHTCQIFTYTSTRTRRRSLFLSSELSPLVRSLPFRLGVPHLSPRSPPASTL